MALFSIDIGLTKKLESLVERALSLWERAMDKPTKASFKEGSIMYIVQADNPDVSYRIMPPMATDSEGNEVPNAELEYNVTSSNEAVVSLVPDNDEDPLTGTIHFGSPSATETVSVMVETSHNGAILGAFGAQFIVTPGDVNSISGGGIVIDNLVEVDDNTDSEENETDGDTEPV